jgi:hypothetical protein
MTWKPQLGLTVLTRSPEQLNVLELVRELKKKNRGMIVDITAISESLTQINTSFWQSTFRLAPIIFG